MRLQRCYDLIGSFETVLSHRQQRSIAASVFKKPILSHAGAGAPPEVFKNARA